MWSQVTMNWRGRPLTSFAAVIALIGATTTTVGLTIRAALDERHYEKGIKMTDAAAESVQIERHPFHGEWNYTVTPAVGMQST